MHRLPPTQQDLGLKYLSLSHIPSHQMVSLNQNLDTCIRGGGGLGAVAIAREYLWESQISRLQMRQYSTNSYIFFLFFHSLKSNNKCIKKLFSSDQ